jgi:hypothetical protein
VLNITIRDLYDDLIRCCLREKGDGAEIKTPNRIHKFRLTDPLFPLVTLPSICHIKIAGAYPGVDIETYLALSSEPSAILGQWNYDFSDPNGPQMGTVALPGMTSVYETEDPVVIIADHTSLGVQLPPAITEAVDLIVLCDRARTNFAERRFLVLELEESPGVITIAAFGSRGEMPANARIFGHVTLVQIPWLPNMQKKKSGFMEEDELF